MSARRPVSQWAVIPASEREQVAASVRRTTVRATVLASREDVRAWARARGLEWPVRNQQSLVDAYIEARYREETNHGH